MKIAKNLIIKIWPSLIILNESCIHCFELNLYLTNFKSCFFFTINRITQKTISTLFFIAIIIISCGPSTVITASWKNTDLPSQKYSRILVAALTSNIIAKVTVENEMATALGSNITVLKSITEFPPDIHNTASDKETIMNKVKNKNLDAILSISLISKETESRYIPGAHPYNPLGGYNYYDSFWSYYSYWYPHYYSEVYYIQNKIYFIETNLYDTQTEKLIWSAQSRTYNPTSLQTFSKEFAYIIVAKMKKDGVLN